MQWMAEVELGQDVLMTSTAAQIGTQKDDGGFGCS
jgi:hypothetical protein